jgi:hypothetical protein
MLNPFFLQGSKSEQNLIQDLINEQLRMYGVEVYYIPRKYATINTIIREVIESEFSGAYPIEAYVNNYEGYGDNTNILSKFGIQATNEINLVISKERFETYITPLIKNIPDINLSERPKEGDLIYFPLGDRLFEIKFVEHEQPFYQLQKTYVYELKCELFRYEDEVIDTGVDYIDDNIEDQGAYIKTLSLSGIGTTSIAVVPYLTSGSISSITMIDGGYNYTTNPTVLISKPPTGGIQAAATAKIRNGQVDSVEIINSGAGYTVPPLIKFNGGNGSNAQARVSIASTGSVGFVTIVNPGSNYATIPQVTFSPSPGITAIGTAVVRNNSVIQIRLINSGSDYITAPTITIESPVLVGYGTYIYNEVIVGSSSSTEARVRSWNTTTNILEVASISQDGRFKIGENIIGTKSGANYILSSQENYDIVSPYSENEIIQEESDKIIDFSETNPFGAV